MPAPKHIAVITADIVGSSGIKGPQRRKLMNSLDTAIARMKAVLPDISPEIFQGDSLQGYTIHRASALQACLLLFSIIRSRGYLIRISIGFGNASFSTGRSLTSDGTAFQHSGRNMEELKKRKQLIAMESDDAAWNAEWEVHTATLNHLLERWTVQQAEAVAEMLQQGTQQAAAKRLRIHQSAVQQRLKAAAWPLIQTILKRSAATA